MQPLKSNRFVFTQGSSDKEYRVQLVKDGTGYSIPFQFGRRNGTLQSGSKTAAPVTLEEAEKIYASVLKERAKKGYVAEGAGQSFIPAANPKESMGFIPQLLNEITVKELEEYMKNDNFAFQEKKDGERRVADKKKSDCRGGNKKGVCVPLPESLVESLGKYTDIELDCELVGDILFAFDLMRLEGTDHKKDDYLIRLNYLQNCKFKKNIVVVETAFTTAEKRALLAKLKADGAEGVVIKDLRAKYSSGRPNSGGPALKYKFYATATVLVTAQTPNKRSVRISVMDNGILEDVGSVTIPPNYKVPAVDALAEVRYLYAYKGGCLYQPTYLGERTDVDSSDARVEQLKYKQES